MTIESPIEYLLSGEKSVIEQREVGRDVPTYREALMEIVNADAEVVYVDRLDDPAVVSLVLELATTRLVLVVYEATNALRAIEHLIGLVSPRDTGPVRSSLADCLVGVVAQRILPRVKGGRIVVIELLLASDSVKTTIRDGKLVQLTTIMQTSRGEWMRSMDQALVEAVRADEVSPEEAVRNATEPEYLKGLLERKTKS